MREIFLDLSLYIVLILILVMSSFDLICFVLYGVCYELVCMDILGDDDFQKVVMMIVKVRG